MSVELFKKQLSHALTQPNTKINITMNYNVGCNQASATDSYSKETISQILESLDRTSYSYYDNLTLDEKKSIFKLSESYLVKLLENSDGITLDLYKRDINAALKKSKRFIEQSFQINQSFIIYKSKFDNVDIRGLVIPHVNKLTYYCGCVEICKCEYVNLPLINFKNPKMIKVSNNGSQEIALDHYNYQVYRHTYPAFLYKHKYIDSNLQVNYNAYLIDYCNRVRPTKTTETSKFWATLYVNENTKIYRSQYKMVVYDSYHEQCFPIIGEIRSIINNHIYINLCEYKPNNLIGVNDNFNSIVKKLTLCYTAKIKLSYELASSRVKAYEEYIYPEDDLDWQDMPM
jgi:hypothetical protein